MSCETPPLATSQSTGKRKGEGKAKAKKKDKGCSHIKEEATFGASPPQSPVLCTRSKTPESPAIPTRSKQKNLDWMSSLWPLSFAVFVMRSCICGLSSMIYDVVFVMINLILMWPTYYSYFGLYIMVMWPFVIRILLLMWSVWSTLSSS
jgi:hypothetical protein